MAVQPEIGVEQAIVAAALDYYEGWFEGDASRMARALHPDLAKRSLAGDGVSIESLGAGDMIDATARGVGLTRDPGQSSRMIEVRVDHVFEDIATVTATSAVYVDYLQLARTREGWKIVNALWAPVAEPGG